MNKRLLVTAVAASLATLRAAAFAETPLDGIPTPAVVYVQPGNTVQLRATLQNLTTDVVFLRGISYTSSETFTGTVSPAAFTFGMPDSLRPGDRWDGQLAVVVVPQTPGTNSAHRLDFEIFGGLTRHDSQLVGEITYALDDSSVVTDAGAPSGVPSLAVDLRPNPTHGASRIEFALPRAATADVRIVDLAGRTRRVLGSGRFAAGRHALDWDARDGFGVALTPGVYFVRLVTPEGVRRSKFVQLR